MTVLRVEHLTAYAYADRVELAWHMVHLRPRQLPWQTVRQFRLITEPVPDTVHWGTDAFGNPVAWLFMTHAHSSLDVTTEAVVEVTARPIPTVAATPAWEDVAAAALQPESAREVAEFSLGSPMAPALAEAAAYVGESFAPGRPILEGLIEVTSRIHRDFRFDAAATTVSTPVARVLQLRAGGVPGFRASDDRGAAGAGAAGAVCVGLSADAAAAGAGADAGGGRVACPGCRAGWGRCTGGSTWTRRTTWWCRTGTCGSGGGGTMPMSARSAGCCWAGGGTR